MSEDIHLNPPVFLHIVTIRERNHKSASKLRPKVGEPLGLQLILLTPRRIHVWIVNRKFHRHL